MKSEDRRAAVAAYKKKDTHPGIFAVRCAADGTCWVGGAPDIDAAKTRLWFGLEQGSHTNRAMQAAWRAHGAQSLAFEVLERMEPEEDALYRRTLLKERIAHWRERLGALPA